MDTSSATGNRLSDAANPSPRARRQARCLNFAACVVLSVVSVSSGATQPDVQPVSATTAPYRVEIRRTADGIPHIEANDWGSLGYGFGYAQAQDALCSIADGFVTWRGERSAYFGPDAQPPASTSSSRRMRNLDSDFFFRLVDGADAVARYRAAQPLELRQLFDGYADGYSRYVDELKHGLHPGAHAACVNAPWVGAITSDDLYRRFVAINLGGGAARFIEGIANARPPAQAMPALPASASVTTSASSAPPPVTISASASSASRSRKANLTNEANQVSQVSQTIEAGTPATPDLSVGGRAGIGSNALAFGADLTHTHRSLLFGNPHWYWRGPDRLYQAQLTIPGTLNVAGAALLAMPVIIIGFNDNVAWTHTVSNARRFGLFQLKLAAGQPTRYLYDGKTEAMRAVPITVQALDTRRGVRVPVTRTLYTSRFGPVVDLSALSPYLGWTARQAFALRDVNADNTRTFAGFLAAGEAASLDAFIAAQKHYASVPWLNTFAIGRNDPRVWFADIGAVPNVPDALAARCTTPLGRAFAQRQPGVPVLDGSRSACSWHAIPTDAPQADALSPSALPSLLRRDYVGNFNGSYWLTNPHAPLSGYAAVIGQVGVAQSLRTRLGHALAAKLIAQPGGVRADDLERTALDSTSMSEQLLRAPVLDALCEPTSARAGDRADHPQRAPSSDTLAAACRVLRAWDGTANAASRGAALWDGFWRRVSMLPSAQLYATPFDPARPLTTPAGLNASNPALRQALRQALLASAADLTRNGFALDAPLGNLLYTERNGTKIPLYGGCDNAGYFTVICPQRALGKDGYGFDDNGFGNSYLQVVRFDAAGPVADTMLAHSESDDPASPHYADATRRYARKTWQRFPFSERAIADAPGVTDTLLAGPRGLAAAK